MIARVWKALKNHRFGLWEAETVWIDARFGGFCGGRSKTAFGHRGASDVHNLSYRVVEQALRTVAIAPDDVLVDVGCGRGRVLNWWLHRGTTNRIVGIELDPAVAARVKSRLAAYDNVEILAGDAVDLTPPESTLCFLFNPFGAEVFKRWHDSLLNRLTSPRLTLMYVNPRHLGVLERAGVWRIEMLPRHVATYFDVAVARLAK